MKRDDNRGYNRQNRGEYGENATIDDMMSTGNKARGNGKKDLMLVGRGQ